MPPADPPAASFVVWRLGDALLAVPLDVVDEVAPVDASGQARGRTGSWAVVDPPGLPRSDHPRQAVVVRVTGGEGRLALAADEVDGVRDAATAAVLDPPPWLAALSSGHTRSLIRLDDRRVAAVLDVAAVQAGL